MYKTLSPLDELMWLLDGGVAGGAADEKAELLLEYQVDLDSAMVSIAMRRAPVLQYYMYV